MPTSNSQEMTLYVEYGANIVNKQHQRYIYIQFTYESIEEVEQNRRAATFMQQQWHYRIKGLLLQSYAYCFIVEQNNIFYIRFGADPIVEWELLFL